MSGMGQASAGLGSCSEQCRVLPVVFPVELLMHWDKDVWCDTNLLGQVPAGLVRFKKKKKSPLQSYLYTLNSGNFSVIVPLVKRELLKHGQLADSIFKPNGLSFSFVFFFFFPAAVKGICTFSVATRRKKNKKSLTTTFKMLGGG